MKSIEAAETLNNSGGGSSGDGNDTKGSKHPDDLKSDSIAALRSKAQAHTAKLQGQLCDRETSQQQTVTDITHSLNGFQF